MIKHRIIDILKTFSEKDIRRFREYLNSPFFNKSKKIINGYKYLISFHPDYTSKNLTTENFYLETGNKTGYNKSTIDNLLSDLSYQAENYLMYINIQNKEVKSKDFLIDELFKRNLNKLIETNIGKVQSLLKKNNEMDAVFYFNSYKIITDELNHNLINKAKSGKSIINDYVDKLSERGMYLTCLFITEMVRERDNLLAMNKTFDINKESNFVFGFFEEMDFEKVLKFLISNSKKENLSTYSEFIMIFTRLFQVLKMKNITEITKCFFLEI